MMYLSEKSDNKREDKHNARRPPTQHHVPQTRPHVALGSLLHHRCATKLLSRYLRSGEGHRPYSARRPRTRRDDRALHRACNAAAPKVVEHWVP